MSNPEPSIQVNIDPTNPGQFFACCGLLELAARLWPEAEGWFDGRTFCMAAEGNLTDLIQKIRSVQLIQLDKEDGTASPIQIGTPFRTLRLDWWKDAQAGGKELKVWAGTMDSTRIAQAMLFAMNDERFLKPTLLDVGVIAFDPNDSEKKVEPFYFDSRRGPNAHSRDVGFSPNDLQMTTTASPAVEFLCLVGLQRCRPAKTSQSRVYDYYTWKKPLPSSLMPAAVSGLLSSFGSSGYRFENWFRTGQKKHKAFRSATPL